MILHEEFQGVVIRDMLTTNRAIDLFAGDLSRRGCSERTRYTYSRILWKLSDRLPDNLDVTRITPDDCRGFLDLYNRKAAGTRSHTYAVLSSFFRWLVVTEQIKRSPLATIARPKRQRPDDLDVTTVTTTDVVKLLAAAQTWTERLAVAIPVYIGPRRRAVAQLVLTDYDRGRGRIRFHEKGGKTIWKPVPAELADMLDSAITDGAITDEQPYLVPPEGVLSRPGVRDDRVIWRVVKRVADRAGVDCHVHALRAAFAVFYLERHPGDTYAVQKLLGHANPQTTQVYLRKLDAETVMEPVRGLSWLTADVDVPVDEVAVMRAQIAELESRLATAEAAHHGLEASSLVGAGGFEPSFAGFSYVEHPSGPSLVRDLVDEARGAAEAGPDVPVRARVA